jgi:hypothetical protein
MNQGWTEQAPRAQQAQRAEAGVDDEFFDMEMSLERYQALHEEQAPLPLRPSLAEELRLWGPRVLAAIVLGVASALLPALLLG